MRGYATETGSSPPSDTLNCQVSGLVTVIAGRLC